VVEIGEPAHLDKEEDETNSNDFSDFDEDDEPRQRFMTHIIVNVFIPKEKYSVDLLMNEEGSGPRKDIRLMSSIIKKHKKKFILKKVMVSKLATTFRCSSECSTMSDSLSYWIRLSSS